MNQRLLKIKRGMFTVSFSMMVVLLVMALSIITSVRVYYTQETIEPQVGLSTATWIIENVEMDLTSPNTYNLRLISSIGNIREYDGVSGYGISNDGRKLATITDSGLWIIDLSTNEVINAVANFNTSGVIGNAISWSYDGEYLSFVGEDEDNSSALVVMSVEGEKVSSTQDNFHYITTNRGKIYSHPKFSNSENMILTRTFDPEVRKVDLNPVILKVFSIAGNEKKSVEIRDTISKPDQITYTWDAKGIYILYSIDNIGTELNFASEHLFNKVYVGK